MLLRIVGKLLRRYIPEDSIFKLIANLNHLHELRKGAIKSNSF
jgi:hypothetical protein